MAPKEAQTDQYVELRTLLDSLEIGALRYYLNAPSHAEQQANLKYLKTQLKPIIDHIWGKPKKQARTSKSADEADPCPDGYFNCNGCCVPYACIN